MIDTIQIRKKIQDKIQSLFPDKVVTNDYDKQRLLTEPDGKILVTFAGGQASNRYGNQFGINDTEEITFSVNVITRDPLEQDIALEIIEVIKINLHGLLVIDFDDRGRLNYLRTQLQQYEQETFQWAYSIDFQVLNNIEVSQ